MTIQKCSITGLDFEIDAKDQRFYQDIKVPYPTLCPEQRLLRRLSFRNESSIYKRKCSGSGKQIISMYSEDKPFVVFDNDFWWSDAWDAHDHAREFNFTRKFFPQFAELLRIVPKMARIQQGEQLNSEFTNCASNNKNCYLVFSSNKNEDCMYGKSVNNSKSCLDCFACIACELCHASAHSDSCYNCQSIQNCKNCHDCYFLENCIGCNNCFGCVNQRNKSYCILNKQVSKKEYSLALSKFNLGSYNLRARFKLKFDNMIKSFPVPNIYGLQNENVSGNYLWNCKNSEDCYYCNNLEDCRYCNEANSLKDCYDISFYGATGNNELLYECEGVGHNVSEVKFSKLIWGGSSQVSYSYECFACHNIFGCAGLRNAKYCIFNKQYSSDEYFKLRDKIIALMQMTKEWGEFFPVELSPFEFHESVASEYFPQTSSTARYNTPEEKRMTENYQIIPDSISDTSSDILGKTLICERSGKNYRIENSELDFYRTQNIPIPRCNYLERLKTISSRTNSRELRRQACSSCTSEVVTANIGLVNCDHCFLRRLI